MLNLPIPERKAAIVEAIEAKLTGVPADKRQYKFERMSANVFGFFRGTNHLFWEDWGQDDRVYRFGNEFTTTWIEGDAHVYNFGSFDNRRGEVVYDLNDFDDAIITDYQYDLWRTAISLVLVGRTQKIALTDQYEVLQTFAMAYLDWLVMAQMPEGFNYFTKESSYGRLDNFLGEVENNHSRKKLLKRWTKKVRKTYRFDIALPKLAEVSGERRTEIITAIKEAGLFFDVANFHILDVAERLYAGDGSASLPRYYVLIEAIHNNGDVTHHILDIKLQPRPAAYNYLSPEFQADYNERFTNHAQRHLMACRALSLHNDMFLGWIALHDGHYSIAERSPYKAGFPIEWLTTRRRFLKLTEQWGTVLGMAHTRSEEFSETLRHHVTLLAHPYRTEFVALLREVAFGYADQVEADYRYFMEYFN